MTGQTSRRRRHFWDQHTDGDGRWKGTDRPSGADLAALRAGLGREPGEVPQMWPYYRTLSEQGGVTAWMAAEHLALSLFAVHQQGRDQPAHRAGVGLGQAVLALRRSDRYSPEAIDRRFAAAATAASLPELAGHLRRLITQLRAAGSGHGLDYTQLMHDLRSWQQPSRIAAVRRKWGSQYFAPRSDQPDDPAAATTGAAPDLTITPKEPQ
jgi:CRISPR system Cascade subunit CasB